MKIDDLLHDDYEEALGCSAPGIRVRGSLATTF
jgi:hypothetical protein